MNAKSLSDIIISPVITEKSTILQESGKYTFKVSKSADKLSVKKAVEELFDVKVQSVNIILKKGKPKTFGRNRIITPSYKKAIVSLASGETINISEGT